MDSFDFESRDAFLRRMYPGLANRVLRGLQQCGGVAPGIDLRKKVTSVVRVVRRKRAELNVEEPRSIDRECSDCGESVSLSLSQAEAMPPDATQCSPCFQQVLAEGFAELQDNGILLSSRAA